jgi:hypothetical protein
MQAEDLRVREELGRLGELGEGYVPRMDVVPINNATRLTATDRAAGVAREACGQRWPRPASQPASDPVNGMNYWFGPTGNTLERSPRLLCYEFGKHVYVGGLRL